MSSMCSHDPVEEAIEPMGQGHVPEDNAEVGVFALPDTA